MDKRGIRILISCIACTVIVLVLFIVALRYSRLTCELISVEPTHLRHAQLEWAQNQKRNKPTRSHDKLMLIRIAAFLEYHIEPTASERAKWDEPLINSAANSAPASNVPTLNNSNSLNVPITSTPTTIANNTNTNNNNNSNLSAQRPGAQLNTSTPAVSSPAPPAPMLPTPAVNQPQTVTSLFPNPAQLNQTQKPVPTSGNGLRAEKRFLPLALEQIETRSLASDGLASPSTSANPSAPNAGFNFLAASAPPMHKQKYILTFNCTKLNMVFVYQANRVWVESMSLELKPTSRGEKKCQLQLPSTGAFAVDSTLVSPAERSKWPGNLAHYYCNKPLKYLCYHYSTKSGPSKSQGILLAELHINSIEFETIVSGEGNSKSDKKQVKSEFKGKRKDCDVGN